MTNHHICGMVGILVTKGTALDRRRSTFRPRGRNRGRSRLRFEFRAMRQDMFNHARQIVTQCFVLPSHRTVWQNFLHCVAKVFALCSKFFCTVWQSFPGRVSWKGFYSEMEVYVAMQHLPQVGDRNGLTSLSYLRLLPPTSPFFTKVIQLFLLLCASCTKRLIPNGHLQFLSI